MGVSSGHFTTGSFPPSVSTHELWRFHPLVLACALRTCLFFLALPPLPPSFPPPRSSAHHGCTETQSTSKSRHIAPSRHRVAAANPSSSTSRFVANLIFKFVHLVFIHVRDVRSVFTKESRPLDKPWSSSILVKSKSVFCRAA